MRLTDAVSRAALGWVFVHSGVEVLRRPETPAAKAGPLLGKLRTVAPLDLPSDVQLVRANAAAQVIAGSALIGGFLPRLAATVLVGSLIPTTAAGHRFWELDDPTQRAGQRNHFNKNLAVIGGLLAVAITPRRPNRAAGPSTIPSMTKGRR